MHKHMNLFKLWATKKIPSKRCFAGWEKEFSKMKTNKKSLAPYGVMKKYIGKVQKHCIRNDIGNNT